jgi:protein TonB
MDDSLRKVPDLDDILFEKRNKEYGAYFLRKRYNRVVIVSIILTAIIGSTAVLIPYLRVPEQKSREAYNMRYVSIENMRQPTEQVAIPDVPELPSLPKKTEEVTRYIAPVVVDSVLPFENTEILTAEMMPANVQDQGISNGSGTEVGILSEVEGGGINEPFIQVEVMPTFKGGDINKFREWIIKRTIYPQIASDKGIEGMVKVTFVVETDGSVSNVKVTEGVDPLLDNEATRVVASSPKWTPGRQRGEPVRVRFSIGLNFRN